MFVKELNLALSNYSSQPLLLIKRYWYLYSPQELIELPNSYGLHVYVYLL